MKGLFMPGKRYAAIFSAAMLSLSGSAALGQFNDGGDFLFTNAPQTSAAHAEVDRGYVLPPSRPVTLAVFPTDDFQRSRATFLGADDLETGDYDPNRADAQFPAGVRYTRVNGHGPVFVSYQYSRVFRNRLENEGREINEGDLFNGGFVLVPEEMTTQTHEVTLGFAPDDRFYFALRVPFLQKSKTYNASSDFSFDVDNSGLGDLEIFTVINPIPVENERMLLHVGLTIPIGSTDDSDNFSGPDLRLPYDMQLGTGTWDLRPGATYTWNFDRWSGGVQGYGVFRIGVNDDSYSLGSGLEGTAWVAYQFNRTLSTSLRLYGESFNRIDSFDPTLQNQFTNPALSSPDFGTDASGGGRLDLLLGLNVWVGGGALDGARLMAEVGTPIYRDINGAALEATYLANLKFEFAF